MQNLALIGDDNFKFTALGLMSGELMDIGLHVGVSSLAPQHKELLLDCNLMPVGDSIPCEKVL